MARHTQLVSLKAINEINLTPMMDLVFVLLITFMITFPLIDHQVPIQLPAGEAIPVESPDALVVTLDRQGDLFLGKQRTTRPDLLDTLKAAAARNPESEVNIRADAELPYGEIMAVIRVLKQAGISNLGLVTDGQEPES